MSVVYEVELVVERVVASDFLAWLKAHVAQMLSLPGFVAADVHEVIEPAVAARCFSVRYALHDADALQEYLERHAPRMRAEGLARFGDGFRTSRRVLQPLHAARAPR